jgi:hypothetical protein
METLSRKAVRRLALARAGLLKPQWTGLPRAAGGRGERARKGAMAVIRRFGYLQLDTVPVAGARSHALVLLSRLSGFDPALAEELLQPGSELFEYWGHEACWLPAELYPVFEFRRRAFRDHRHWGQLLRQQSAMAGELVQRVRAEGPLRSLDLEGESTGGWYTKQSRMVASGLWRVGELAIRQRRNFQRTYDLSERVIPEPLRARSMTFTEALPVLLGLALDGHGWASEGTLAATWRLVHCRPQIAAALAQMEDAGEAVRARVRIDDREVAGWVRPADLELAERLVRVRPRRDQGVLLSPFDPVLWDRRRVAMLFGFDQLLEIFKPAAERLYGYYCLPVLAGDRLVARYDLKADAKAGRLEVLSLRFESSGGAGPPTAEAAEAARSALQRHAAALGLRIV